MKTAELPNIGPKTGDWLAQIGVRSRDDIERLGSVTIYQMLRQHGFNVSLNLVYALEAMLIGVDWRELPPATRAELKAAVKGLTG